MQKQICAFLGLVALLLIPAASHAQTPSSGLWVGEVILNNVAQTVSGIDANNNVVAPDPTVTTPVQFPAHLRILLHVDGSGQVRLLKTVTLLTSGTNNPPQVSLITDPTLYPNYTGPGQRIGSAAYDFGDNNAIQIVNAVANAAAGAAAAGGNPTTAATKVVQSANFDANYLAYVQGNALRTAALLSSAAATVGASTAAGTNGNSQQILSAALSAATNATAIMTNLSYALTLETNVLFVDARYAAAVEAVAAGAANGAATVAAISNNFAAIGASATNGALVALTNSINAPATLSAGYVSFISSNAFRGAGSIAGTAAAAAAASSAGQTSLQISNNANAAALLALSNDQLISAADNVVLNELPMNGTLAPGGRVTGTIYMGASHPTNPFRHRHHPDHTIGYAITRLLTIQFDSASSANAQQLAGFGVTKISGTYREEIFGLHKPLGSGQNRGLLTDGTLLLNLVSPVAVLNQ